MECVKALALCHNVTPVEEERVEGEEEEQVEVEVEEEEDELVIFQKECTEQQRVCSGMSYQASSPDEVCS